MESVTIDTTKNISPFPHRIYPLVHTLHSEWIDSPINSPSNSPSKMSTITESKRYEPKYETPKTNKFKAYITPESNKTTNVVLNEKLTRSSSMTPVEVPVPKHVPVMDILWSMINNITGKDKMSKTGQYLLRLLIHHAKQSRDYLSDDVINISTIDKRYNDRSKRLNLIRNFLNHPMDFARIVVILLCSRFVKRFQGMVNGIGMYRQFLRFGKTPFRVKDLYYKFTKAIKDDQIEKQIFTKKTLGELIGLYYGFNDECLLLFKLGILTNKSFRKFAGRHESLAWYYDSILGIYNALQNINSLSQQEMEMKIQIQVKNKAKALSKQILNLKSDDSLFEYLKDNSSNQNQDMISLQEIQFKKTNAYLDLYKWLSDFIFDSYTVFNMKLPFKTFQIWFGLIAASLSTCKIYRETQKKLSK